jgi:hypothetical protein
LWHLGETKAWVDTLGPRQRLSPQTRFGRG